MFLKKLKWDEKYLTGVKIIDTQHQNIFEEYNLFCGKINNETYSHKDIETFLKDLNYYTTIHFETEEEFMEKENYPLYNSHKKRHNFFRAVYEEIKDNKFLRDAAEGLFTLHLAETVAYWLESHIETYDKQLADFLKERGY